MSLYQELNRNKDFKIWIWKNRICSLFFVGNCTYLLLNYMVGVWMYLLFIVLDVLCILMLVYSFKPVKHVEVCVNKSDAILDRTILIDNSLTGEEEMIKLPKILFYHTPIKGEEVLVVRDYKRAFGNVAVYRYKTN